MSVFLTGDLHGAKEMWKLREFDKRFGEKLDRNDFLIILGDFGLPWNDPPSTSDESLLEEISNFPWTTLFLDGNHENFDVLDAMSEIEWRGGRIHMLRDNVFHLMRGYVFRICGNDFLVMGGARSINAKSLAERGCWWSRELPSKAEKERCIRSLEEHGNRVDYVLTHCPPAAQLPEYNAIYDMRCIRDDYGRWLQQEIANRATFHQWFYGHMHDDRPWEMRYVPLMHVIYSLDPPNETGFHDLWSPNRPVDDWYPGEI